MNKKELIADLAAEVRKYDSMARETSDLYAFSSDMANSIEMTFLSIEGITSDELTMVAMVFALTGTIDIRACMVYYASGGPVADVKDTASAGLSYIIAAHHIFESEGVYKTLGDHFAAGAREGS